MSAHARRQVHQQADALLRRTLPAAAPLPRRVLTELLARTAEGWQLFVGTAPGGQRPDAFLVGRTGITALVVAEVPPDEATAQAVVRHADERCAGLRVAGDQVLTGSAVRHLVVTPGPATPAGGMLAVLAEKDLPRLFGRDDVRLTRPQVTAIANRLEPRLSGYQRLRVDPPDRPETPTGLLDAAQLAEDELTAAQERPFDTWLTFLHPDQQKIVTRRYGGPARISGPAGTGKTVVALHRLRHLATRSVGPLLCTTFVRTLSPVYRTSFERLAPTLADRVEFVNLHAWARRFLAGRGVSVNIVQRRLDSEFNRAWARHRERLEPVEDNRRYWRTEIDRVIKGRGLRTLEEYRGVNRRGRVLPLGRDDRAAVWELYETYQENLDRKGLHDHNDLLAIATAELAATPLDPPYAAVVVDEVQDITLTGLRLLRELAGDGPDRLLLVGDGQQQVYPGGWRLSDAGIPVQGRGEVLRVNYRNRTAIVDFARRFDAVNHVDDLDGDRGYTLAEATPTNTGGTVRSWHGPESELSAALAEAVAELPVPLGHAALIVFHHNDLRHCVALLTAAGVPWLPLDRYEGGPDDRLKVGTVHRAKGLDFQAVLALRRTTGDVEPPVLARQYLVAATRARDHLWWGAVERP